MRVSRGLLVSLGLGLAFGAVTSFANALSSPYDLGSQIAGTGWASVAEIVSLILDAGWSWAALAVGVGWLIGVPGRGALAGVAALMGATVTYLGADVYFQEGAFAGYIAEVRYWWAASVILGPVLGVVGAGIRRPGMVGLLCVQ